MPVPTDLLDALDPEQRRVAEALRGPVRVLAGAGTGKTRAITHRIAHGVATGVYAPSEVLAVTFTTRAAGEMRTRLRSQLDREGITYSVVDIEQQPDAALIVEQANNGNQTVPTLVYADGSAQTNPSLAQVKEKLAALA